MKLEKFPIFSTTALVVVALFGLLYFFPEVGISSTFLVFVGVICFTIATILEHLVFRKTGFTPEPMKIQIPPGIARTFSFAAVAITIVIMTMGSQPDAEQKVTLAAEQRMIAQASADIEQSKLEVAKEERKTESSSWSGIVKSFLFSGD